MIHFQHFLQRYLLKEAQEWKESSLLLVQKQDIKPNELLLYWQLQLFKLGYFDFLITLHIIFSHSVRKPMWFHFTCWYLSLRPDTKSFVLRGIFVWVTRIFNWGILQEITDNFTFISRMLIKKTPFLVCNLIKFIKPLLGKNWHDNK